MNLTRERLQDIEQNGYQLDFSNVFNHAFENYKKIALYAGLVLFIFTVLFVVLVSMSLVSIIGVTAMTQELNPEKFKIENLSDTTIWIIGGASLIISCLFSPMQAGFLKMADCGDKDEEFHISTLFGYYKLPYLTRIIVTTFIISAISFLQARLLSYAGLDILGNLISYFILFITYISIPLIIFGGLKAIEAIKYSILIILKQPLVLLGLIIVAFIGSLVGFMGCCIGLFFTLPFMYSIKYAIYHNIVGIDSQNEIAE